MNQENVPFHERYSVHVNVSTELYDILPMALEYSLFVYPAYVRVDDL